jgi:oligopeptide transport system substrate-binding protein
MRTRNSLRTISFMLALSLLLAMVIGGASAQEPKVLVTGLNMVGADPDNSLDPSLSSTVQSIQILDELYIGLTHLNELTSAVEPGMATDWTISEDGLVYTFNLMQNVPWVRYNAESGAVEEVTDESGNVRYVTANDFVFGITRTLDPNTGGDYAYVLAPYIVNGVEFNAGEAAAEDLGIRAIDDWTLEITSPEAVGFAINIYGLWMARAQASWMIDEFGDTWVEAENRQTYGPFAMKSWNHDQDITLAKNPFWPGTEAVPQPKLDEIVFRLIDDTAQFAEYQAGTMQAATPPSAEIDRIKADAALSEEYYAGFDSCSLYYGFNYEKAPFDNVNIRKAFSLAIDRESIVNDVTRDGRIASRWYSRPGITGAPTLENNPDLGVGFDPEGARAALEAGLADLGLSSVDELPAITLGFGDTEYNTLVAQAVQQMWAENLGVEVQLSAMETTTYFDVIEVDAPQVFRAAWCMDYPDANNFLYETTRSDSPNNYTNWSNAEFDQLVDEARVSTDQAFRAEAYARAEQILVAEEYAMAPIFWYVTRQVVKPEVERTYSAIGLERYEKWDIAG